MSRNRAGSGLKTHPVLEHWVEVSPAQYRQIWRNRRSKPMLFHCFKLKYFERHYRKICQYRRIFRDIDLKSLFERHE